MTKQQQTKSGVDMLRHVGAGDHDIEAMTCDCCQTIGYQDQGWIKLSPTPKSRESLTLCEECHQAYGDTVERFTPFESDVIGREEFDRLAAWVKAEQPEPENPKPATAHTPATPLPWRTEDGQIFGPNPDFDATDLQTHEEILICDAAPDNTALTEYDQANMDFIVRAVNSHAELVEACEAALTALGQPRRKGEWRKDNTTSNSIRAALEKAGAK